MATYYGKSLVACPICGAAVEAADDGAYVIGKGHSGHLAAECSACGIRWTQGYENGPFRPSPWDLFFPQEGDIVGDPRLQAAGRVFKDTSSLAINPAMGCGGKRLLSVTPESGLAGAFCRRMRKEFGRGGYRQAVATLKWFAGEGWFFAENYDALKGALDVLAIDPRALDDRVWRAWGLSIVGSAN